jgi:hypothetical protein
MAIELPLFLITTPTGTEFLPDGRIGRSISADVAAGTVPSGSRIAFTKNRISCFDLIVASPSAPAKLFDFRKSGSMLFSPTSHGGQISDYRPQEVDCHRIVIKPADSCCPEPF